MSNKKYIGNAKDRTNKFGDQEVSIGIPKDDLEFLLSKVSDTGWVNVTLCRSKEGKPYVQFWEPTSKTTEQPTEQPADGLPF